MQMKIILILQEKLVHCFNIAKIYNRCYNTTLYFMFRTFPWNTTNIKSQQCVLKHSELKYMLRLFPSSIRIYSWCYSFMVMIARAF